ncbi:hypothetical protein LTR85_007225 [Meristemomyces frigidus]|nr:hypothetical protein LTR85_007225 [Meristemomyces frigidus]
MDNEFLCVCCREYHGGNPTYIEGDKLCTKCVQDFFETSMTAETNWPPRWSGKRQHPQNFKHVFDDRFLRKYRKTAREWDTPEKDRIYCRQTDPPRRPQECGTFLGRLVDRQKCQQCRKCKWYTCSRCLGCFSSSDVEGKTTAIQHECDPSIESEARELALTGLKRGWHYQDCPNPKCQRRVELAEACRQITCLCGQEFCYKCGQEATKRSGHWDRAAGSNCPLYPSGLFADDDEPDMDLDPDEEAEAQWQLEMLWDQHAAEQDIHNAPPMAWSDPQDAFPAPYAYSGNRAREWRHDEGQRVMEPPEHARSNTYGVTRPHDLEQGGRFERSHAHDVRGSRSPFSIEQLAAE